MRPIDTPYQVGDTRFTISWYAGKFLRDAVMVLDGDGNVLDEIPVVDALIVPRTGA